MTNPAAIKAAIELMHLPSRVHAFRLAPIPEGTTLVLGVAAGDQGAENEAVQITGRSADVVRRAADFFIEQILLVPGADSYRVLGVNPDAPVSDLRLHMALLLRCLHPDLEPDEQRSLLAARVTKAWETVKTPERRASYDQAQTLLGAPLRDKQRSFSAGLRRKRRQGSSVSTSSGVKFGYAPAEPTSVIRRALDYLLSLRLGAK